MPKTHRSPLSESDMDVLQAFSAKFNAFYGDDLSVPLYVAIDIGDATQRDGYMFISWPALNSRSAHCARLIFDFIRDVARVEFGAVMTPTSSEVDTDAAAR